MRLHRPGHWFFLSPDKFYFSSCNSVLLAVRHGAGVDSSGTGKGPAVAACEYGNEVMGATNGCGFLF
jgi:hypothetical protein